MEELNNMLGFRDGISIREKNGFLSSNENSMNIYVHGYISKIYMSNLVPGSMISFKVNGWNHTESRVDEYGNGNIEFHNPIDLDKIHAPQLFFKGCQNKISYTII